MHVILSEEQYNRETVDLTYEWSGNESLVKFLLTAHTFKEKGVVINCLHIPYVPFSPQDRVNQKGECFSLKWFTELINGIGAKKVIVTDPHSDVTPALINNCKVIPQHEVFAPLFFKDTDKRSRDNFVLVSPDAGSLKKINKLRDCVGPCEVLECSKRRNTTDGQLSNTRIHDWRDEYTNMERIIVDDVAWGGRTFTNLSLELSKLAKGNGKNTLMVSHGFFTSGLDNFPLIDEIYTRNGRIK